MNTTSETAAVRFQAILTAACVLVLANKNSLDVFSRLAAVGLLFCGSLFVLA